MSEVVAGIVGMVVLGLVVAVAAWRVPRADEALVVTGRRPRVVRGGERAIVAAARHFTHRPEQAEVRVASRVAARMRAAAGRTPAAALVDAGAEALVVGSSAPVEADLDGLGLELVGLDVVAIGDPTGHLADLVRPRLARAAGAARIAAARAEQEATEAEESAATATARARRDAEVARAGFDADIDRQAAWARHAGPLAAARARRQVADGHDAGAERTSDLRTEPGAAPPW